MGGLTCSCGRELQPIPGQPVTWCPGHCDRADDPGHMASCGYCDEIAEAFGRLAH